MKTKLTIIIASLVIILILSACQPQPAATPATEEAHSGSAPTVENTQTAEPTKVPAVTASCPVGKWQLTDFASYILSMQQNLTQMTESEVSFSNTSNSGSAYFEYRDDKIAVFSADDFSEEFTMLVNMSGTSMEIPVKIDINGTSTATYTISGDTLTYSNQDLGDLSVLVDVMGTSTPLVDGLFGQPGSTDLYQFACPDANTLTLKVIAVETMDLDPLSLTRIP